MPYKAHDPRYVTYDLHPTPQTDQHECALLAKGASEFRLQKWIEAMVCLWLVACIGIFVFVSRRWPMVGDATLMHYVVFLTQHGMEPYRDVVDMNLPGSYILEAAAIRIFGAGSFGWRLYDLTLLALSLVSSFIILRPHGRLAGLLAATLFILVHGRDGALMMGERDLAAAIFLQCSCALLFMLSRRESQQQFVIPLAVLAGAGIGFSITIKPTLVPLGACLLIWTLYMVCSQGIRIQRLFVSVLVGCVIPLFGMFWFLWFHHAIAAFFDELHGLIAYHVLINQTTLPYLLSHSIAPLLTMAIIWLIALCLPRQKITSEERAERIALLICSLCGLLSFVVQKKAFWYQRYPFLVFLIPLFIADFSRILKRHSTAKIIGILGYCAGVVLTTQSLMRLVKYGSGEPPRPLIRDLATFGPLAQLSGHVQCMDTFGPCIDAMYSAQIVQNTGFIYDCYMLDGSNPVALALRHRFWQQMIVRPPRLIVVTDSVCYDNVHSFDKFSRWPEFQNYLKKNYSMAAQSGALPPLPYWSHPMTASQYRIYMLR